MTALAPSVAETLVDHARRGAGTSGHEPIWRSRARSAALAWIAAHGFPSQKDEDWRYLPLAQVLDAEFEFSEVPTATLEGAREILEEVSLGVGGGRLVFVNGRFAPELSRLGLLPRGARLTNVAAAQGEPRAPSRLTRRPSVHRHAFDALNTALAVDGALLELGPGVVVDEPIELVFLTAGCSRRLLVSPRSVLRLGRDSRATIIETHAGTPGSASLANACTRVHLDTGAALDHHRLQVEPADGLHFSSLEVYQGPRSQLCAHLVALGSRTARHEAVVHLGGEEARASLNGLYVPRDDQYHDQPVLVEHGAPRCVSRQRYVGVVDGAAHAVFNGHVIVRPGATGTDARQSNSNLLLSAHAEVDTRPRLEILADDVACSHGATVGRLDHDALFYLRSRGIPEGLARALLVQGFARQMTERIEFGPLRTRAEELIAGRLGTRAEAPGYPTAPVDPGLVLAGGDR